jgi:hypothetical protein
MNKTISRRDILTAIRNEPLNTGSFVNPKGVGPDGVEGGLGSVEDKNCTVCAVGAVLRKAGLSNREIEEFGEALGDLGPITPTRYEIYSDVKGGLKELLKEKKYLHALSVKFEGQAHKTGVGKRTRKVLSLFVKKNFPKRIRLNPEF